MLAAGVRGPVALEDAVALTGWLVASKQIPPVDEWIVRERPGATAEVLESMM